MSGQSFRILIIEDDQAIAGASRRGWGAMAIALSGKDFWRQARQLGLHQPILMLTVRRDEIDMALRLGIGADDYLTNPYGLRELLCEVLMRDQWRIPGG